MLNFGRWTIVSIVVLTIVGILFAVPNLFSPQERSKLPEFMNQGLTLGLDLQGGAHFVMAIDEDQMLDDLYSTLLEDVHRLMRDRNEGERISFSERNSDKQGVTYALRDAGDADEALRRIEKINIPIQDPFTGMSIPSLEINQTEPGYFQINYSERALSDRRTRFIKQAIEVLRNRLDALGTTEPLIQQQGEARILVQVPGLDDTSRVVNILNSTAKLSFHLVEEIDPNGRIPSDSLRLPERDNPQSFLIVKKFAPLSGENLVDASSGFDPQQNTPSVNFRLDAEGARVFGRFSSENIGRRFAIILDNEIISAPVIRSAITGGNGQITGNFTVQTANDLALLLRAGALPVKLNIIEERTVGPSLGADSVAAGKIAGIIAIIAVMVFILLTYGLFGLFADISLLLNIGLVIGILSALGATLTLPGIAGLVLTIGMAVDANVLIFERIKEEAKKGRSALNAIDNGFSQALSTILDANITTLIAAIVLFFLGSGPIRGFSVTLTIGVITTMFTAYAITRLFVAIWVNKKRPKTIPI